MTNKVDRSKERTKTAKNVRPLKTAYKPPKYDDKDVDRCGNCKYHFTDPNNVTQGVCRRRPPIPIVVGGNKKGAQISFQWPIVKSTLWCGEWKPRGTTET